MNEYRKESFIEFIKRNKPPVFLWVIWIGSVLFLIAVLLFSIYKKDIQAFLGYVGLVGIGNIGLSFFFFSTTYNLYSQGRKAYLQFAMNSPILSSVRLRIKNFDLFKQQSLVPSLSKAIYTFSNADVVLSDSSFLLLGLGNEFGTKLYAAPVEIAISRWRTSITKAKILDWSEDKDGLIVRIQDPNYKKPITIVFKDHLDIITGWLKKLSYSPTADID